jgi:IclR family acetate operon transcriptional repressor
MKSAHNVLSVVEELAAAGPLGVGELARRTGIAKSTVQRCLDTLATAGWIELAADARPGGLTTWTLSARFAELGRPVSLERFVERARPRLESLAATVGESVHLVMLDGTDVALLDRVPGPGVVQIVLPEGFRVPAYAAATGKAMLAALDPSELAAHLPDRLRRLTASTVRTRAELDAELAMVRARGWATNTGEWEPSVVAVAAPVRRADLPPLAVSVSSTPQRLPPDRTDDIARALLAAARSIQFGS